jgi:hypothetical protein
MNPSRGDSPPTAIRKRSLRIRSGTAIRGREAASSRRAALSSASATRSTRVPPYGAIGPVQPACARWPAVGAGV